MLQASNDGLGRGLDAVATATVIIELLQQHHVKVIQPHVTQSPSESNACSTGLATLIRSVEERVLASMQAILNAFFAQVHSITCLACLHHTQAISIYATYTLAENSLSATADMSRYLQHFNSSLMILAAGLSALLHHKECAFTVAGASRIVCCVH